MVTVKVQCRLDKEQYDLMVRNLGDDESISDFIREAVRTQNTLRLLEGRKSF